jgi:hypothetical protein
MEGSSGSRNDKRERFFSDYGLECHLTPYGKNVCPPGEIGCREGKHEHGLGWKAIIKRIGGPDMIKCSDGVLRAKPAHGFKFDYWAPQSEAGKTSRPTLSDIVSAMAYTLLFSEDPDEVAIALAPKRVLPSGPIAIAETVRRLRKSFTDLEIKQLESV